MGKSVAIVAIARNENQYINNWIEYHINIGISHFYIYDNSHEDEERIHISSQFSNYVTIVPMYDKNCCQKEAYNLAYSDFGKFHDYLAFIDIDEFITLIKHDNISDYIGYVENCTPFVQIIRANWEIYDDNGVITRDETIPVQDFFTRVSTTPYGEKHKCVTKSIVLTGIPGIEFTESPHYPCLHEQELITCNGNGGIVKPIHQRVKPPVYDFIKLRHYITKTLSEFMRQQTLSADTGKEYNLENKFFRYCERTDAKISYYKQH